MRPSIAADFFHPVFAASGRFFSFHRWRDVLWRDHGKRLLHRSRMKLQDSLSHSSLERANTFIVESKDELCGDRHQRNTGHALEEKCTFVHQHKFTSLHYHFLEYFFITPLMYEYILHVWLHSRDPYDGSSIQPIKMICWLINLTYSFVQERVHNASHSIALMNTRFGDIALKLTRHLQL